MRVWIVLFALGALVTFGCSHPSSPPGESSEEPAANSTLPKDWAGLLGQSITVEGTAQNAKLGAVLSDGGSSIWIDELDSWPEGFCVGEEPGKRVRVTGTVIERSDLPVFVPKEGEPPRAGIPVAEGTDLEKASRRFLLKDAKWDLVK